MQLWLSKSSEVPLREQLVTQIILGVASSDLAAGERLPSTRELARRYKIHSNTVSAAYRELAQRGWVEFRKGSGVYVKSRSNVEAELDLDKLISNFFKAARDRGYSLAQIRAGLERWSSAQPDRFLVIEPDPDLRQILIAEVAAATGRRVVGNTLDHTIAENVRGAIPVLMQTHLEEAESYLPRGEDFIALRSHSVPESMQGEKVPAQDVLITVVSCWAGFLQRARAVLVAAGVDAEAMSFKDARQPDWRNGLATSAFVITDSLMAQRLPLGCLARVFRIISDASLEELRHAAENLSKE